MNRYIKNLLWVLTLLFGMGLLSLNADLLSYVSVLPEVELLDTPQDVLPQDTVKTKSRYPVSKTYPDEYEDLLQDSPADLRSPDNVKTTVEYDLKTGTYVVRTLIGEMEIATPITLSPEEYQNYSFQQSIKSYYRDRNEEEFQKEVNKKFNITDMQFDIGVAEEIFGPGGIRVRTQGSADIEIGMKTNSTDNPALPVTSRRRSFFNFDESVQLNMQANVGTKVDFNMNYNTESSFDFDSKKLKLAYTGEEDEIIKLIEAGNVSMQTSNSLINGGAALFGMKADLQFGKLRINALLAQQESESKTVSSKGGVQTKPFELNVDAYDENRHFFLAHYFRDNYDHAMEKLPFVRSSVTINRMEVWITNKRSNYDQSRNIVAFADLAEHKHIFNPEYTPLGNTDLPYNGANTQYQGMLAMAAVRDIGKVTQALTGVLEGGREYEKIESARLLNESEYTYNKQLGYISLKTQLQTDEVLAVAYQYTSGGVVYQVGEFSSDNTTNTTDCLYLKLLKGTNMAPSMPFWDLMMKNVYSLGAYSVQKEKFKLDILFQSDTTGVYLNYLTEGNIKNSILLRVMNLDRLDRNNEAHPDGFFDFVEGFTILPENGKVIFPVVEPFGSHLRKMIANDAIAKKYVFQELYDSTLVFAQQVAEKNKFRLQGEYKASSGSEINLGATNVARGSVRVTAGGVVLAENVDYTVDYAGGVVTILNESIIAANTPVSVQLENQSTYSMQRKTMMGIDVNYQFSKDFILGGTLMHMSEMPMTTKTVMGSESVKNTLWGINASYKTESQWLTNVFDKLPLLTLTKPSQVSFNAEFAHLIAGHYENEYTGKYSYIDDFESTQTGFDLKNPFPWQLSSVPYSDAPDAPLPEASKVNDTDYGKNRALLAWYYVDGLFTRTNSSSAPSHIRNDKEQLSDHRVRAVYMDELFPNRDLGYNESSTLQVLNMAYYPAERGPYNLDYSGTLPDGSLADPEKRFGGMMRRIEQSDMEKANIEYISFWMMDPFIVEEQAQGGGDLVFNLGEISEDILKDEKKYYENGMPVDGDLAKIDTTVWGKVPTQQSTVYAFDNTSGTRRLQDVGLNGLQTEEEKNHPTYQRYLSGLQQRLSPDVVQKMMDDTFSPFNDPAGDNFHYFRGSDYDANEVSILNRYKRYNGTEGNSAASEDSPERYTTSAKILPDVEDINQDNTLNEQEKYYEYRVSMRPEHLQVGSNYVISKRISSVRLANGTTEQVTWYQFKIPIRQPQRTVGNIHDFKSIRYMRMYMTGFKQPMVLRFGAFDLIRGEWRSYTKDLSSPTMPPASIGTLDVSSVNVEEHGDREPVNYILPPGVTRMLDPGQPQLRQQNEQSLSLKVTNLAALDARAVYKNTFFDFRQYKRMQLFTHAESFINDITSLASGELSVFIRLGSDYRNNYYEYEVPLKLTPHAVTPYKDTETDKQTVWPVDNFLDFPLAVLTNLKLERNRSKREGAHDVSYHQVYSSYDPEKTMNKVSIVGNPSLAEVKTIMIGVRNNTGDIKSGEVWVNELRLTDFDEEGGWAANANLNISLSDFATVDAGGRIETAGFGALDQSISERRLDDLRQYNIATTIELGKFFPEKAKVSLPFYYAYQKQTTTPKYNPLDKDILLKEALDVEDTQEAKDSILELSVLQQTMKSIAVNNVRVDIQSETPMPYDPANFSFGYAFNENSKKNPETEYETTKDYKGNLSYNYTPYAAPFRPFKKLKSNKGYTHWLKQLAFNYLPSNISFQTAMMRNYYEMQLRDLNKTSGGGSIIDPTFSQNFTWDRAFNLRWNLTNNLNISFTSGTNARIEEPYMQVNKELNPDQYQVWKDSVMKSIADLGTPMKYDQTFNATFNLPLQYIPALDFINASTTYNAQYNWDRGASMEDETIEIGNNIKNQRQFNLQSNLNFLSLYNKNKYLKKINTKYSSSNRKPVVKNKEIKIEKEITLNTDSGTIVRHGMFTKKVRVRAVRSDGKVYRLKYKPINYAQILIENLDTVKLKITMRPGDKPINVYASKALEYTTRFLMMLRRVSIQYALTDGMMLPGFRPEIGDVFGQGRSAFGFSPGLDFAFGFVDKGYIKEADERGWLVKNESNVTPAMLNSSKTLTLRANLEPIPGLKIDLDAKRLDTRNTEVQYMFKGSPEIMGGNFTMTTIAIGSALRGSGNAQNGYASKSFELFLNNRAIVANRLEKAYAGSIYPNKGFLQNTGFENKPYDPKNGSVSLNSPDVLIPSFIAAYTGRDPESVGLTAFPNLAALLPNWRMSYDGLIKIPSIRKHLKTLTLNHQYRATYSVGSFSSFLNWVDANQDGLGYVRDVLSGNPTPSSPYEIASVSITDGFSPLLGVDATMLNNITARAEYRTTRNLSLNLSSYQIVESLNNEVIIGMGYKFSEFNKVLKMKKARDFSNDLTVRFDYSYRKMQSFIRKIENQLTQATAGNIAQTLQFSADYGLSRALTLRAFYDLQINKPLITSTAFPTSNSNYGVSVRFSLAQ